MRYISFHHTVSQSLTKDAVHVCIISIINLQHYLSNIGYQKSVRSSIISELTEAIVQRCCVKKLFLEIGQNSQSQPATLLKKRLWHRSFHVISAQFLRTPFLRQQLCSCFKTYFVVWNIISFNKNEVKWDIFFYHSSALTMLNVVSFLRKN